MFDAVVRWCQVTRFRFLYCASWETDPVAIAIRYGELNDVVLLEKYGKECALARPEDVEPYAELLMEGLNAGGGYKQNFRAWRLLQLAVKFRKPDIVRFLFSLGGATYKDFRCLHFACENRDTETLTYLLDMGTNVNAHDDLQRTPLMRAVIGGYEKEESTGEMLPRVVLCLLDRAADVHAHDKNGKTALSFARETKASAEVLRLLLDRGAFDSE